MSENKTTTLHISLAKDTSSTPSLPLANFSISGQDVVLCVSADKTSLTKIRKAARQLAAMARHVSLQGVWSTDEAFAFSSSFMDPKQQHSVDLSALSNHAEVNKYLQAHQFTCDIVNGTPQDISPETLAATVAGWITALAPDAVNVNVIKGEALKTAGWHGIYEVGRGSVRPPVLLDLDFNPSGDTDAPVNTVLVGKGITFDSGGYSIKSSEGMLAMKCDMGGAATVSGGLGLAIMSGLQQRTRLILCCAENLISGHAYKLGDIITYKNGITVEVVNTDAEGRLVLADGLMKAAEYQPNKIIDAATLTGAAVMAVGPHYNALFSMDDELRNTAQQIATQVHEPAWPLPLAPFHQDNCPSPYADTANSRPQKGGGAGGASNAAGFLSRFVPNEGKGWLHVDLAAAFNSNATATHPAGATAQGIRMIAELLN